MSIIIGDRVTITKYRGHGQPPVWVVTAVYDGACPPIEESSWRCPHKRCVALRRETPSSVQRGLTSADYCNEDESNLRVLL